MIRTRRLPLFNVAAAIAALPLENFSPTRWFDVRNLGPTAQPDGSTPAIGVITMRGVIGATNQERRDWYYDEIIEGEAGTVKELEKEIDNLKDVSEIHIYLTSPGGSVWDALVIADILNRHPAKIVAIVEGYAFSAATVLIVKCADEIRMAANAWMMIHDASVGVYGVVSDLETAIALLNKTNNSIAETYASRGGGTTEDFRTLMTGETYLTGQECLDRKLCDVITDEVVLTNFLPLAANGPREKMPPVLRELFDTAKQVSAPNPDSNPTPDPDMTPAEVQSLINQGLKPLEEQNASLKLEIENTNKGIATSIENATKPLIEENTKLKTELDEVKSLHGNGILSAKNKAGDPVPGAGDPPPVGGAEKPVLTNMSSLQLIAHGRKKPEPA